MVRRRPVFLAACLCIGGMLSASAADAAAAALHRQWDARLSRKEAGGTQWAAQVLSLASGRVWIETNAALRLIPASNTKLVTGALALDRLGPDHRRVTSLRIASGPDASGRLAGALRLVGGGDPTLTPRVRGGSWDQVWKPFVDAVRQAGIRRVDGGILCDEGRFRGPPHGSGWDPEDLVEGYGAAVSALTAGDNTTAVVVTPGKMPGAAAGVRLDPIPDLMPVDAEVITASADTESSLRLLRLPGTDRICVRGAVPSARNRITVEASVPSPALWTGMLFRKALQTAGIEVTGPLTVVTAGDRSRLEPPEARWRELVAVPSPPLRDLVREMMKRSQNLHAQLLLLSVGEAAGRPPTETSEAAGLSQIPSLLRSAGIDPEDLFLEEGSGLSRKNLATPRSLTRLLVHMARHPAAADWMASLPVGGVDGTLRTRFTDPHLRGKVRAKTGTLRQVQTLSGYVTNAAGEPLVFSILANGGATPAPGSSPRAVLDALVADLAASRVRSE